MTHERKSSQHREWRNIGSATMERWVPRDVIGCRDAESIPRTVWALGMRGPWHWVECDRLHGLDEEPSLKKDKPCLTFIYPVHYNVRYHFHVELLPEIAKEREEQVQTCCFSGLWNWNESPSARINQFNLSRWQLSAAPKWSTAILGNEQRCSSGGRPPRAKMGRHICWRSNGSLLYAESLLTVNPVQEAGRRKQRIDRKRLPFQSHEWSVYLLCRFCQQSW